MSPPVNGSDSERWQRGFSSGNGWTTQPEASRFLQWDEPRAVRRTPGMVLSGAQIVRDPVCSLQGVSTTVLMEHPPDPFTTACTVPPAHEEHGLPSRVRRIVVLSPWPLARLRRLPRDRQGRRWSRPKQPGCRTGGHSRKRKGGREPWVRARREESAGNYWLRTWKYPGSDPTGTVRVVVASEAPSLAQAPEESELRRCSW